MPMSASGRLPPVIRSPVPVAPAAQMYNTIACPRVAVWRKPVSHIRPSMIAIGR